MDRKFKSKTETINVMKKYVPKFICVLRAGKVFVTLLESRNNK